MSSIQISNHTETVLNCLICNGSNIIVLDPVADLSQCKDCNFVFVSPRPTPSALAAYYSTPSKYDGWIGEEIERDALWKRRLKLMSKTKKAGSLLDVGTGIGQLLYHARQYYSDVFGTEISKTAVSIAKQKYGLNIIQGQLEDIEFNQFYDNISLFHILEHVPNPASFLKKCHSILTPGGIIILAVPNDLNSWELKIRTKLKKFQNKLPQGMGRFGLRKIVLDGTIDEIHLSQFTPETISLLLEKSGFRVVKNTLDPYFPKKGLKLLMHNFYYYFHLGLLTLFGINRYNTIFVIARKKETL